MMSWIVVILQPNQPKTAKGNVAIQGFTQFNNSEKIVSMNSTKGITRVM